MSDDDYSLFERADALPLETDWTVVDGHQHTSLATALEGVVTPSVIDFIRSVENETQPETSQTSESQTAQTSQRAERLFNIEEDISQNSEQQILDGYRSGVRIRSQSDRLDVVFTLINKKTSTANVTRGGARSRVGPLSNRGTGRGGNTSQPKLAVTASSNNNAPSGTNSNAERVTTPTGGTTRSRGRPRGSRGSSRGKADTNKSAPTPTRGTIYSRGRPRGRCTGRTSSSIDSDGTSSSTSNKPSSSKRQRDTQVDSGSDSDDPETQELEEELDQLLSAKHSEDQTDREEPDDHERTIYCNGQCRGCKGCRCVKAGYLCIDGFCSCNNCGNKEKKDTDPLSSWTKGSVSQKDAKFDASKSGPKGISDAHQKTVTDIVDLLWSDEIWNHIKRETNAYMAYCNQYKKEIAWNKKVRRSAARPVNSDVPKKKKKTAPLKLVAYESSETEVQPTIPQQQQATRGSETRSTQSRGSTRSATLLQSGGSNSDTESSDNDSESDADEEESSAPNNTGTQSTQSSTSNDTGTPQPISTFTKWFADNRTSDFSTIQQAVTVDDLKKYFTCSVVMGLQRVSNYRQHWKSDTSDASLYGNRVIKSLLSLARFKHIHRYIHYDPDWLEDELNKSFKAHWSPKQNLAVDEAMIAWKGRVKFKQYQPAKPCKYGLKKFVLCDETEYVSSSWLYRGRDSRRASDAKSVVLDFADELPKDGQQYILFFDNYYASLDLSLELEEKGVYHVCTVRGNRPTWLFSKGMQDDLYDTADERQWTYRVHPDGELVAYSYCDSKRCNFLSNYAGTGIHKGPHSQKPNVAHVYNKYMGAVDKSDAMIHQCLPFPHRKNKWTRAFMLHSFKTALVNSWILYRHLRVGLMNNDKDRNKCMSMTQNEFLEKYVVSQNLWIDRVRYNTRHSHYPMESAKKERCAHCYTTTSKKKKSTCNFKCPGCKVNLHTKCFLPYHLHKRLF